MTAVTTSYVTVQSVFVELQAFIVESDPTRFGFVSIVVVSVT